MFFRPAVNTLVGIRELLPLCAGVVLLCGVLSGNLSFFLGAGAIAGGISFIYAFTPLNPSRLWSDWYITQALNQLPQRGTWFLQPVLGQKLRLSLVYQTTADRSREPIALQFELVPISATIATLKARASHADAIGNSRLPNDLLSFETLRDHLEIKRCYDPMFADWQPTEQGLTLIQKIPLFSRKGTALDDLLIAIPAQMTEGLRRLIQFDWRQLLQDPNLLRHNRNLRDALIPIIWKQGGTEGLTEFHDTCADLLDEESRLLIALLLDHKLNAAQRRLMLATNHPLIQAQATAYYRQHPHEHHLFLGACAGDDGAVKRVLNMFDLAEDPRAIPHLIAWVRQPYLRALMLAELATSSDPRVLGLFLDLLRDGSSAEIRQAAKYVGTHGDRDNLVNLHIALKQTGLQNKADLELAVQKIKARFPQTENQGMLSLAGAHTLAGQLSQEPESNHCHLSPAPIINRETEHPCPANLVADGRSTAEGTADVFSTHR